MELHDVSYGIDSVARPLLLFFSSENRLLWFRYREYDLAHLKLVFEISIYTVWSRTRYDVSKALDTGVLGFLGVGTTFDIFQNIHILYLQYGVLTSSRYGVLSFIPLWSLVLYRPVVVNEEKRQNEILLHVRITTESEVVSDNRISNVVEKGKDETVLGNRIITESSIVEKRENDVVMNPSISSDSNVAVVEEEEIKQDEVVGNLEVQSKESLNHSIELTYEQIKKRIDH
ncbi:hypothetical protein Tco_0820057 [Tanacetum coccineum]|uniref:Uncharacterized protein n=1 Tax=Tanacetum coccineum TaxID=301880 RepID=A0ABQ5ACB6_9ASTR